MNAQELINSFSDKFPFQERKQMAKESIDKVISKLLLRDNYDGIEESFSKLNKLKREIDLCE